ncbi:hypothetical protein [Arthrobacter sp. UYEF3]
MEREASGELEGPTSINERLDEPISSASAQLVLPVLDQVTPGQFRRVS